MAGQVEQAKAKALAGIESQVAGPRKAAESAAAKFLGQAPSKADDVGAGLNFGPAGSATGTGELDKALKLLSQEPSADALLASMEKELAGLSTASAKQRTSSQTEGATQSSAAETALKDVAVQAERLGDIRKTLAAELERLKSLK